MTPVSDLWVYLSASPLLHLVLTLIAYQAGDSIYQKLNRNPLANPVLFAVTMLVTLLTLTDTGFDQYFDGAQFVHFLLGPATVALAIPLYKQLAKVKRNALPLLLAIVTGSLTASLSAIGLAALGGLGTEFMASIAPKSVTSPIAMGIAEKIGGLPSLTAVLVILTGITGAALGPLLLNLLRIRDLSVRGTAIGVASHGIGVARAMQVHETSGAFAGLAMGLNGLFTAILLPVIWLWLF